MRERFKKTIGQYYIGRTIGEGTYAKVKYGEHMKTAEAVAIKILDKKDLAVGNLELRLKREIRIMQGLRHPNVVRLHAVLASRDKVYLVMDLVPGGELFDQIVMNGPMKEAQARRAFQQMVDGLQYVHQQGIYHRDLKPENVLIAADGTLKLSDFGLGALPEAAAAGAVLTTMCGTPNYVAPEVLADKGYQGAPADVWSLGVCLYVMLAGCLPFEEPTLPALFRRMQKADYRVPPWFTVQQKGLLALMLQPDPNKRATLEQVRKHPWFAKDYVPLPTSPPISRTPSELPPADVDIFAETVRAQPLREAPKVASPTKGLNAFQLISAALDISALFERRADVVVRATRFTSRAPPADILAALGAAAGRLGATFEQRDEMRARLRMTGSKGPLSMSGEVLVVVPGLHMVELRKAKGDSFDFHTFFGGLMAQPAIAAIMASQPQLAPPGVPPAAAEVTAR